MRKREISSIVLLVLFSFPVFAQAFSIDRNLGAGEFYAVYRNADAGWRIEGSFSVNNEIEFFICDAGNYTRWQRHESAVLHEHSVETTGQMFNFTVPYTSIWYAVFSNVQSQDVTNLDAELYYIDQSDITQSQVTWTIQSSIVTPLFIGFLVAVLVVCLLGIWLSRRGESQPAVRYDEILPKPS